MNQVQAKVSFYHDLTGSRAQGEVFKVDTQTEQMLQEAGYIQQVDTNSAQGAQAQVKAEIESKQQQYGQEQAQANERVSLSAHEQNLQANQLTQEMAQQSQQKGSNYTNQTDQKHAQAQEGQAIPTADPMASVKNRKADK